MSRKPPWFTILLLVASCAQTGLAETRPALSVRVMSFNLRWDGFADGDNAWGYRRDLVYRVLREFRPDSVGTQEPMIRQIEDFERVDAGGFLVAEGTNEEGTVRYCTWVLLADRESGRRYFHYNVHLDHRDRRSRELSAVRLMRSIAGRGSDDPFVVTGDFNEPEDGPAMAFLFGRRSLPDESGREYANPIPLVDTYRVLHPAREGSGTASGFGGRRDGGKIDFVLVAAGAAAVREASIIRTSEDGRYPSDHFPVAAGIEWP